MIFIAENKSENELARRLAKEYHGTAYDRNESFGVSIWSVNDLLSVKPNLTPEAAEKFLEMYEGKLREQSISGGWDFLEYADYSEVSPAVEYNGWSIFEKDGIFTVGGGGNSCFEECTLECLPTHVDEWDMVEFCRNNNLNVAYLDLYGSGDYVSYEAYREHLAKYDTLELAGFTDEEFIVPVARFESLEQAKRFLDWVENRERSTMREDGKDFVVKNVIFTAHDAEGVVENVSSRKHDAICRISLEKAPSAEYEKAAKDADGHHYEPDNFFIEATVGRDGPDEPWQTSNWFLFYLDVNGNSHLLDDTLELPDAWKYIQSECEKLLGNDAPEKKESLDALIAAAARVTGEQQRPERTSRRDLTDR